MEWIESNIFVISIVLSSLLSFSFILNCVLIWFTRNILSRFRLANELSLEFFSRLVAFREHLGKMNEIEVFRNDPVLENLYRHIDEVVRYLDKHEEVYSFVQPDLSQIIEEILEEEEEVEDDPAEEEKKKK